MSVDKIPDIIIREAYQKRQTGMSDEELDALTNAIKTRYGLDFTNYEKASLKRGFTRLIQKYELDNVVNLWYKIMKDREFLLKGIDELTVNLTELFRNPEFWIKLREDVLPQLSNKNNLSFWHAGCSSGEEVYTMAIVLKELNLLKKSKTIATDLSSSILQIARTGTYSNIILNRYMKAFNHYSPMGIISNWFDIDSTNSTIKENYRNHIDFIKHDLVKDPMNKKFDIILCRNVMIYFDDILKMKVLKLFHTCLNDDGFFAIGYYDMLPNDYKTLFEPYDSSKRLYKKIKLV
jgi:chemotaxis protein methyltransferase CheR